MADEQFLITYDGPALATSRMDVRLLAPALIGMADVIQVSNRVMNPGAPNPGLHIEATRPGSFSVELILMDAAGVVDRMIDFLAGDVSTATANGLAMLTAASGALMLLKRLARRKIRSQEEVRPGWVRITFSDSTTIEVPSASIALAEDLEFRRAANEMVEPLRRGGIEVVSISRQDEELVRVVEDDLPGFDIPLAGDALLSDQTRQVALRLLNVAFVPGNKWRVSDGDRDLFVGVGDLSFLERVETNQETFSAGDILRCQLRTQQFQQPNGAIRNEHTVVRVLEHIRGPRAVPLPFEDLELPSVQRDDGLGL
ncbi:hypothetical protein [Modestobacter marinus]|uniref:hypothetical protein n=1 Tax=Modestobacter marinus TaxID=477641 RepID=UPI001C977305|nr:hypothetical protein [Modestobacter marinus]